MNLIRALIHQSIVLIGGFLFFVTPFCEWCFFCDQPFDVIAARFDCVYSIHRDLRGRQFVGPHAAPVLLEVLRLGGSLRAVAAAFRLLGPLLVEGAVQCRGEEAHVGHAVAAPLRPRAALLVPLDAATPAASAAAASG